MKKVLSILAAVAIAASLAACGSENNVDSSVKNVQGEESTNLQDFGDEGNNSADGEKQVINLSDGSEITYGYEIEEDQITALVSCKFDGTDTNKEALLVVALVSAFEKKGIDNVTISVDSNGEYGLYVYENGEMQPSILQIQSYTESDGDPEDYESEIVQIFEALGV